MKSKFEDKEFRNRNAEHLKKVIANRGEDWKQSIKDTWASTPEARAARIEQFKKNGYRAPKGVFPEAFKQTNTCEHCGITCTLGNFTRWHGDNCKEKPNGR